MSVADITDYAKNPKKYITRVLCTLKEKVEKGDINAVIIGKVSLHDVILPSSANPT